MPKVTVTDEELELLDAHKEMMGTLGVSPLQYINLLPLVGQYAETLKADSEMLTAAQPLWDDLQALAVKYGWNDLVGLFNKYQPLITRFRANWPANQEFIEKALPLIKQDSGM